MKTSPTHIANQLNSFFDELQYLVTIGFRMKSMNTSQTGMRLEFEKNHNGNMKYRNAFLSFQDGLTIQAIGINKWTGRGDGRRLYLRTLLNDSRGRFLFDVRKAMGQGRCVFIPYATEPTHNGSAIRL